MVAGKLEHIADVALKAGVAYTGYRSTGHWTGGLSGLIALELAKSPNLAAGLAGTGMLAWLGLSAFVTPAGDVTPPDPTVPPPIPGTQYIPEPIESQGVLMPTADCLRQGGSIVSIIPMTTNCICQLPPVEEVPISGTPGTVR